ncbi:hypothetical protein KIN20_002288 [Parelaphostrongylus tenuis]|uniref:Uncharacterized protein n=1 Tax=Parelaphostrongylus tenuis TaxID=148309 RepID=A0AAD5LUY6_PARTN|nr:hypothetical protein KIN20_002288 [Parelaphostrongylus tenuis]
MESTRQQATISNEKDDNFEIATGRTRKGLKENWKRVKILVQAREKLEKKR